MPLLLEVLANAIMQREFILLWYNTLTGTKSNLCRKGLMSSTVQVMSITEGRQDKDSGRAGTEAERVLLASYCLACFLTIPGPPTHRWHCLQRSGPSHTNHHKKLSYRTVWWGHFLSWSLFLTYVNLMLKLASTGGTVLNDENRQGWEYVSAVNHFPCMHKAPSSIASTM
jgi:hypothetical protein